MELLRELLALNEGNKTPLRRAAAAIYRRDYQKTKDEPYRKYDPEEYKEKKRKKTKHHK